MAKTSGIPDKIKKYWNKPYAARINKEYQRIFSEYQPDLVFIYNDQLIAPDIVENFGKKIESCLLSWG